MSNHQKIEEDRALLTEQNKEYADSLAKDLAKKAEKEKAREAAEQSAERKRKIHEYREKVKGATYSGPLRLLIRYPNGARSVFAFSSATPLEHLFDAIISNPACPDYFSVRTILPRADIYCFPGWYHELFNAEVDEESRVGDEKKRKEQTSLVCEIISNNSILFINMIH